MKTIATIATTLLLSLGVFVSPASAADEPGAVWDTPLCDYAELAGRLNELLAIEKVNVAQANESVERLTRIANRSADRIAEQHSKISDQRKIIRDLRRELRHAR